MTRMLLGKRSYNGLCVLRAMLCLRSPVCVAGLQQLCIVLGFMLLGLCKLPRSRPCRLASLVMCHHESEVHAPRSLQHKSCRVLFCPKHLGCVGYLSITVKINPMLDLGHQVLTHCSATSWYCSNQCLAPRVRLAVMKLSTG
jgi:hypothetical protein